MSIDRRSFVRYASLAAAGHLSGLRPFGALNALAESTSDYKALVCIFLFGGNDSNNMLVPFDSRYSQYEANRGPLALAKGSLLQLDPAPTYALHPNLPDIRNLFNNGNAAFVANVGTLVQPLSRAQYVEGVVDTPSNLFSHPDQQLEWQNAAPSATTNTGWAGRIADMYGSGYGSSPQIPMITSVAGGTLFCNGANSSPVAITPGSVGSGSCSVGSAYCPERLETAQQLVRFNSGLSLVQMDNEITGNAYKYMGILADAVQSITPLKTQFPANNGLAAQLRQIAQVIQARGALGINRQIFFAGLGSFDTHAGQLPIQNALLAQISAAMASFYQATQELGLADQITSFTMSDFSRALEPNANNGSDHAWGGHHIVLGGAVKGGKIYGTFPSLALNGDNDSGTNGRWIPTTASAQYAATLASWFGVQSADLPIIFPTIANFSNKNLGFIG
jgi:uncharacterized protein (DUF1501 family)